MKGTIFAILSLCIVQYTSANRAVRDGHDLSTLSPEATILESQPAQMIAAIYRRATVQALQTKVTQLHSKLSSGQNAIPEALDILKIALLSEPTQQHVRKAAEQVLKAMSPEMKKNAANAVIVEDTTPMNQQQL